MRTRYQRLYTRGVRRLALQADASAEEGVDWTIIYGTGDAVSIGTWNSVKLGPMPSTQEIEDAITATTQVQLKLLVDRWVAEYLDVKIESPYRAKKAIFTMLRLLTKQSQTTLSAAEQTRLSNHYAKLNTIESVYEQAETIKAGITGLETAEQVRAQLEAILP